MTMTTTAPGYFDSRRCLAWAGLAALLALTLGGCASQSSGGTGTSNDLVTASDESDGRKRARIRLELAVGYFEQGQTDVALDEVKQVIATDATLPDAYNLRGLIYMRLNENRLAEESFRYAASLNPRDGNIQHNYGWLLCQQARYVEAQRAFDTAMANPIYGGRAKTLMAQGLCQARAGQIAEAEHSLSRSYELDAASPVTGFNLASLLFRRGDNTRAQFYIRRLNNSEYANAETLWLGIKVERRLEDLVAMRQLGTQLKKRFPTSREAGAYDRGAFNE
jgi:type IV pilus assembly protein PilF